MTEPDLEVRKVEALEDIAASLVNIRWLLNKAIRPDGTLVVSTQKARY